MKKHLLNWFGLTNQSFMLFDKLAKELEKSDRDFIALKEEIGKDLRNVCKGIPIDLSIKLPKHITPELTLNVYAKITFSSLMSDLQLYKAILDGSKLKNPYIRSLENQRKSNYMWFMCMYTNKFEFNTSKRYHEQHIFKAALFQF